MAIEFKYLGAMWGLLTTIRDSWIAFLDPNNFGKVRIMQSDIDVPVHLKDGAVFREQTIDQNIQANPATITLDKGGMKNISVDGHFTSGGVTAGVIFTVEYSDDGVNWENDYVSGAAETDVAYSADSSAQFWRISVPATAQANDLVTLKLAGVN